MKTTLNKSRWLAVLLLLLGSVTLSVAQPYPNSGDHTVCLNSTEPYGVILTLGSSYSWSILPGTGGAGTITGGATQNLVSVLWTSVGTCTLRVIETSAAGCDGLPIDIIITVNPVPDVTDPSDQVVCAGALTAPVAFTGTVPGTVFNWVNDTPGIGLAANGTGDIAAFNTINLGITPIVATITVTPSYNSGATCIGTPQTFTITVNPAPIVTDPTDQVVCNGDATAAVNFTGNIATGVVYDWVNDNPAIGLAAIGTGDIASFVTTNATGAPIVANITVTPSYTNGGATCPGVPETFTITVNPTPTVVDPADQVVCNGAPTTAVNFTGAVTGTVYNWTNSDPTIGLAATGTGDIASFNAINLGATPVVATITVTPSYTNAGVACTGTPETFTITVNPAPTVNDPADQVVCNSDLTAQVLFTGNIATGVDYNWTNDTPGIGLAATGTGDISAFAAINLTAAPIVATITVTPSYSNGGATCPGVPETFTITVNPTPTVVAPADQVVCNGEATQAVIFTGAVTGTVYNWTNSDPTIGLAATGTGDIASFNAINLGATPIIATITVTPSYTNGGVTCTGTPVTFTITVNPQPLPTITASMDPICFNTSGVVYTTEAGMSNYTWNVAGGTITAGGTNTDNTVTVTWDGAPGYTVSVSYTSPTGCSAPAATVFNVNVTPLPVTSPIYHN